MHAERYGYAIEGEVIELVSFKVTVIGKRAPLDLASVSGRAPRERSRAREVYVPRARLRRRHVVHRSSLVPGEPIDGPAVIEEEGSTTLVEPGMTVERVPQGSLVIRRRAE